MSLTVGPDILLPFGDRFQKYPSRSFKYHISQVRGDSLELRRDSIELPRVEWRALHRIFGIHSKKIVNIVFGRIWEVISVKVGAKFFGSAV